MRKADALRLRKGTRLTYGAHWTLAGCYRRGGVSEGEVLAVSEAGGIQVANGTDTEWVPYHHVVNVIERAPRDAPLALRPWRSERRRERFAAEPYWTAERRAEFSRATNQIAADLARLKAKRLAQR